MRSPVERFFSVIFVLTCGMFFMLGLYFKTIKPRSEKITERISRMKTQFIIPEKREEPKKVKIEKKKRDEKNAPAKEKEKPIDLTEKPKMGAEVDDIKKTKQGKKVRRVYGLRRVYSKGIGSGGALSDAVVGKLGNTLNKDVDTLTATREDIKGEVVSVTTVTSSPRFRKRVKPSYSKEMLQNRVEGTVKVKVLVDIDGKVKEAKVLNDLGFDSAKLALSACYEMEFEPAKRGEQPVAVWIIIPIRFELLG
jgi:TonB family protein